MVRKMVTKSTVDLSSEASDIATIDKIYADVHDFRIGWKSFEEREHENRLVLGTEISDGERLNSLSEL